VSQSLGVSRNHLTQIINAKLKKNFYTFVNEYRVMEIKARIKDPKNEQLTLLALAYDSGFNSKSAFNMIFKNATGVTPSDYRKKERPE